MLANYLLIAFRNIWRNKLFIFTNTLALGISIASCIAAYLWVAYDREFDDFHKDEKVERIYKLHTHWGHAEHRQNILSPFALGPTATNDISGIKSYTRYGFEKAYIRHAEKGFVEGVGFADSSFYSMFDFPVHRGELTSFNSLQYAVISKKLADKLFGDQDPIQKQISVKLGDNEPVDLYIGAIIEDIPHNSSFTFDVMLRMEQYQKIKNISSDFWGVWPAFSTFFELDRLSHVSGINDQIQKYAEKGNRNATDETIEYQLEHFKADFTMKEIVGAMVNVRMYQAPITMLAIMALMLFMIACFNLSNTSFSLISRRMKEIGIRKSLGALKHQIFTQFLLEVLITITLSLITGLALAKYIVPVFADMWANGVGNRWDTLTFRIEHVDQLNYLIGLLLLVFLGVALAGVYPALSFSRLQPVALLKTNLKVGGTNFFNRILLVFQFSVSLMILILGVVFVQNTNYMLNKETGFDDELIMHVKLPEEINYTEFKNTVDQFSGVEATAVSPDHLGMVYRTSKIEIDQMELKSRSYFISEDYIQVSGIKLKEGRGLLKSDYNNAVLISERFMELAGIESPIGKVLHFNDRNYIIAGVVNAITDNWYMVNGRNQLPKIFSMAPPDQKPNFLVIRTKPNQVDKVTENVAHLWKEKYAHIPFESGILLQDGPVKTAKDLRNAFIFLTLMTVLLSCLGIYTLAALNVRKRRGEIGIRKVLGASIVQIIEKLNTEFIVILVISGLIGSSVSAWLLRVMTNSNLKVVFVDLSVSVVFFSSVLLVVLGAIVSGFIILNGANQNPIDNLRENL